MNDILRRFGEVASDVHVYQRQEEVMLVGDFDARVENAGQPDDIIGQYAGDNENANGGEMLKFLEEQRDEDE